MFEYEYRTILCINSASKQLRRNRRLLVYGTCIRDEYPQIYEHCSRNRVPVAVCLEQYHMNLVVSKLASILVRVKPEELTVLTVDGSPHCVQLHHSAEEAIKVCGSPDVELRHLVIENGRIIEVDRSAVKAARYLSKIGKLMKRIEKEGISG